MFRLGIIGTGIIAHEHVKAIKEINDDLQICAISNRTKEKAISFAKQYGIHENRVYNNYVEMLNNIQLDAVIINLANHLHVDAFVECARRGIAVLLEKPMAKDSEGCKVINKYASKYNVKLMIGHTQRYNKNYITAKKIINSGELGKIIMIKDTIYYNYFWQGRPQWFLEPDLCGGGIMVNYGVHTFDRVQFLSGCKVKKVFAHIDWEMEEIKVDSSYQVMALMDNGVSVSMTCTGYTGPFVNYTDIVLKNGILRVVLHSNNADKEGVWLGNNEHDFEQVPAVDKNPYLLQLKDFVHYLKNECSSPIDGHYGHDILKQVEACYLSNSSKSSIAVNYN